MRPLYGGPKGIQAAAEEHERIVRAAQPALANGQIHEPFGANFGGSYETIGLPPSRNAAAPDHFTAAVVRAALADVIDEGRSSAPFNWTFDKYDETERETERRMEFIDAVEARAKQLAQGAGK